MEQFHHFTDGCPDRRDVSFIENHSLGFAVDGYSEGA